MENIYILAIHFTIFSAQIYLIHRLIKKSYNFMETSRMAIANQERMIDQVFTTDWITRSELRKILDELEKITTRLEGNNN